MTRRAGARAGGAVTLLCALLASTASADFAPVDGPGQQLAVSEARLAAALACRGGVEDARRAPVLLVHGTSLTREENWSAAYGPALSYLRIPWCAVALPDRATGDIQTHAEYVVHAIRRMRRIAGRRIAIIGASQGGMLPRWALRFWPDTRAMVEDLVALAPSNHGTTRGHLPCRSACRPAHRQQLSGSRFMRALNSVTETFREISYTNVYTRFDAVVTPPESAELHTGDGRITNVAVQDICSIDPSDHMTLALANATGFALAMDALGRDGPADVATVAARGCAQPRIPGYDPARLASSTASQLANREAGVAPVRAEPPLRCYVTAACPRAGARLQRLSLSVSPRRVRRGRRVRLRVGVRALVGGQLRAVRGAVVRVAGRRRVTGRGGRATLRVRFRRHGPRRVSARAPGFVPARATIRVVRDPRQPAGRSRASAAFTFARHLRHSSRSLSIAPTL